MFYYRNKILSLFDTYGSFKVYDTDTLLRMGWDCMKLKKSLLMD